MEHIYKYLKMFQVMFILYLGLPTSFGPGKCRHMYSDFLHFDEIFGWAPARLTPSDLGPPHSIATSALYIRL